MKILTKIEMMALLRKYLFYLCLNLVLTFPLAAQYSVTAVTRLTENIIQFEKAEFTVQIEGAFVNPYDDADIAVNMLITTPAGEELFLPCFYVSGELNSEWRARFAPRIAGSYSYRVQLLSGGKLVSTSPQQPFIAEASAKDGFIVKNDNWTIGFDSGKKFRGIGENIGWEGRSWEDDKYTYDYFLPKLASEGGNYFRTWMGPWNLPLEWKTVVDTDRYSNSSEYLHPQGIQRMDELVELCDSLGLYMMLALDWHGSLQTGDRWNINPYNTVNGGPALTPTEFFTLDESRARYKNRLRYIVARWGYSTSIGAWEFFNEIDNAVYNGTESQIFIPHQAVTDWHKEMAAYLKAIDPYDHLVTTSVSHREITGLFNLPELDFVQKHFYRTTGNIPSLIKSNISKFGKPFVVGEFGYDWDWNNINSANGSNLDYDFKRGLWYGLFSPTPVLPLSWWWEFFDSRSMDPYFRGVREIHDQMLLAEGDYNDLAVTSNNSSLEVMGLTKGDRHFIYLLNNSTASATDRSVTTTIADDIYLIRIFDTENQEYTSVDTLTVTGGSLVLSDLSFIARESRIFILSSLSSSNEQTSYHEANRLPGKIEAEDFDMGGEGVAYHDLDDINLHEMYRHADGVDIMVSEEGGFSVTNIVAGEWLEYTVDIESAGQYLVSCRVSSVLDNRAISLQLNGKTIDLISINSTAGSQSWETVTDTLVISSKGKNILRIYFETGGFDLNYLSFELLNEAPVVALTSPETNQMFNSPATILVEALAEDKNGAITKVEFYSNEKLIGEDLSPPYVLDWQPAAGTYHLLAKAYDDLGLSSISDVVVVTVKPSLIQTPFPDSQTPHLVPGKIEAENFDQGIDGIAFHDETPGNIKGLYRNDVDPDIEACADDGGGFNLADIQSGEWVEYQINVTEEGKYDFVFRIATLMDGQKFDLSVDQLVVASNVTVTNTKGWQLWEDVKVSNVTLPSGIHIIRLSFSSEYFNINYFTINKALFVVSAGEVVENDLSVFPNPASGAFTIKSESPVTKINIINSFGEMVHSEVPGNEKMLTIFTKLSSGVYLLALDLRSGEKRIVKIFIQP